MMSEAQADTEVMRSAPLNNKTTLHTDVARECLDPQRNDNRALAIGTRFILTAPQCSKESPNTNAMTIMRTPPGHP